MLRAFTTSLIKIMRRGIVDETRKTWLLVAPMEEVCLVRFSRKSTGKVTYRLANYSDKGRKFEEVYVISCRRRGGIITSDEGRDFYRHLVTSSRRKT